MLLDPSKSIIAVTSRSFSRNEFLRSELEKEYKNVIFNDEGKSFTKEELIDFLKPADGIILALDKIDKEVLEACPNLKVISKYGVGLNNIPFKLLQEFNIKLGWTGGVNKRSVSELTLGFMISALRAVFQSNNLITKNIWKQVIGETLTGKTVGVVGLGHVGKDLVNLLKPFGCKIIAHDTRKDLTEFCKSHEVELTSYENLLKRSHIITFHVPFTDDTESMLNYSHKDLLINSPVVINTARGGIVNEADLIKLMNEGAVSYSCFDVLTSEPPIFENHKLLNHPNFYCTTHIGGSAKEAIEKMGKAAISGLSNFHEAIHTNFYDY